MDNFTLYTDTPGIKDRRVYIISIMQFQKISILPPTEGIGISWGVGDSVRSKNLKKCKKLNCNFQGGGGS